jgi:glycosyltransferase involved in cell wall biosynthesis
MSASDNDRLKVVALVRRLTPGGGAERVARDLVAGLDPGRFERILCVSRPPEADDRAVESIAAELRGDGVRIEFLRRRKKYDPFAWWPLLRMLRREQVDVLHAHGFGQNAWATVLGRLAGVPVVIAHEHTWAFSGRALRPIVDRHVVARGSDAILVVSDDSRQKMIDVERIAPDDLLVLHNGIRGLSLGDGRRVRSEFGIDHDAPLIGTVAILRRQKALDVLLRAAVLVRSEVPDLRVLIVGEGSERASLEALIHELELEDTVLMPGLRVDVPDILAALDVAVICSDFEGTPLSVLEFMDAGKPIVATRVGGVPELIDDGLEGILVPPRDEGGLAAAIMELLHNPERARELGARAQARRRRDFDLAGTLRQLEDIYERLHAG